MNEDLRQRVQALLDSERFGVLATAAAGRIHTATILFASRPGFELVFAIRPVTLKANLAGLSARAAFHVDNRAVTEKDRTAFGRVSIGGILARIPRGDPAWPDLHEAYVTKLPFGVDILRSSEVDIYTLRPDLVRAAFGAEPAEDITVTGSAE